jgi:uncharacterized membrane protein
MLEKIRPKLYKKTFFIGNKPILKLTSKGLNQFFFKLIWGIIVIVMILSMVLGGLAIMQQPV